MIKTKLKTAPVALPVTLEEVKTHLVVSHNSDDDLIESYLSTAIEFIELQTGRKLITQAWELICDEWSEVSEIIPFGNLQSVTSIVYKDADELPTGVSTDDYKVAGVGTDKGQIVFLDTFDYPELYEIEPITVEFVPGYGLAVAVPDSLKSAIKLKVSELYEEADTKETVNALCSPYRLRRYL